MQNDVNEKNIQKVSEEDLRKLLLECIMKYEYLERKQLIYFAKLLGFDEKHARKTIDIIVKEKLLFANENGDILITPNAIKDHSLISSFWVLCEFIKAINPRNHFRAQYPSDIFFIKDRTQYEIMSPNIGDEFFINIIKEKNQQLRDEDKVKLIMVVQNEEQLNNAVAYTSDIEIMFAQILNNGEKYPSIKFIML